MELPQLFGSDYVLPAIIAVVLLAAILGLLMLRRKRNAASAGAKSGMPAAAAPGAAGRGSFMRGRDVLHDPGARRSSRRAEARKG